MQGEQYDIMVTWGHLYLELNMPAIKPRGESMPNIDMFRRLAKTMGFDDAYWDMSDDEWLTKAYDWDAPALQGITLDILKKDGWEAAQRRLAARARPACRRATSRRPPASASSPRAWPLAAIWSSMSGGRATPSMQEGGYVDPVPNYIPPHDEMDDEGVDTRPLPAAG